MKASEESIKRAKESTERIFEQMDKYFKDKITNLSEWMVVYSIIAEETKLPVPDDMVQCFINEFNKKREGKNVV